MLFLCEPLRPRCDLRFELEDVQKKVQYDLEYLRKQGVAEDLKIMLKTIPVILFRRGGW